MREVTIERTFPQAPSKVWPLVADLDRWLEPGLRWTVDEGASRPGERLVARFWDQPTEGEPNNPSYVTVDVTENEEGGSNVVVTEQTDRTFTAPPYQGGPTSVQNQAPRAQALSMARS